MAEVVHEDAVVEVKTTFRLCEHGVCHNYFQAVVRAHRRSMRQTKALVETLPMRVKGAKSSLPLGSSLLPDSATYGLGLARAAAVTFLCCAAARAAPDGYVSRATDQRACE